MAWNPHSSVMTSFTLQTKLSSELTADEVKHKILLPCLLCRVQDLPDSDGMYVQLRKGERVGGGDNQAEMVPR